MNLPNLDITCLRAGLRATRSLSLVSPAMFDDDHLEYSTSVPPALPFRGRLRHFSRRERHPLLRLGSLKALRAPVEGSTLNLPAMSFWNRPAWSSVRGSATPEKKSHDNHERPQDSSPLSDPPHSSLIDLAADVGNGPGAQLHTSLSQSVGDPIVEIPAPTESFQSTESAGPPSSSASFPASQRILKEGKEVVISSDGEESDSSLEDPSVFLAPKLLPKKSDPSPKVKPNPDLSRPPAPKKYANTIASIFQSAEADEKSRQKLREVEEELSRVRGARDSIGGPKGFQESALTSAFGDGEDENGDRRKAAVQRLEALDQDRTWHFFDPNQIPSVVLEFPRDLISPGSNIAALRGSSVFFVRMITRS